MSAFWNCQRIRLTAAALNTLAMRSVGDVNSTASERTYFAFFFVARTAAHRFFVASIIRRRPSGLSRRFVFFAAGAVACVPATLFAAHLLRMRSDGSVATTITETGWFANLGLLTLSNTQ